MLGPTVLAASGCGAGPQSCAGQCRPPYQLQVVFRTGTYDGLAVTFQPRAARTWASHNLRVRPDETTGTQIPQPAPLA